MRPLDSFHSKLAVQSLCIPHAALGFRVCMATRAFDEPGLWGYLRLTENHMEKKMQEDMETGLYSGYATGHVMSGPKRSSGGLVDVPHTKRARPILR